MFNDYARNMSRNIYDSKQGTGLKILTPNQILLLNKIRQIAYSLYRSKKITRNVYNNIIKPIKV